MKMQVIWLELLNDNEGILLRVAKSGKEERSPLKLLSGNEWTLTKIKWVAKTQARLPFFVLSDYVVLRYFM